MTRTLVLMSEQPLFDTLVLEAGRGLVGDIPAEGYAVDWTMDLTRMGPEFPAPEILDILERTYGPRLDDELVEDATRLAPPLPATGAIPLAEITGVQTAAEVAENAEAEEPRKPRSRSKRVPVRDGMTGLKN